MTVEVRNVEVRPRLRLLLADDALALTPPRPLVQGLLSAGSLALLFGESNTGKSTVAVDIGLAIATGSAWRGMRTRRGAVLHVAGEGLYGLSMRLRAYRDRFPAGRGAPYGIVYGDLDLLAPGDVGELLELIGEVASAVGETVGLVILDTLARCAVIDENDGAQMRMLVAACDRIRAETGAAVLLIHHAGKDTSKGARGHSSLRAAVDTELLVEGRDNPRTLTVTKQRDLPTVAAMQFDLDPVTVGHDSETDEPLTACVVAHKGAAPPPRRHEPKGRNQLRLLGALREHVRSTGRDIIATPDLRDIAKAQGISDRRRMAEARESLERDGWLVQSVGGYRLHGDQL